LIIRDVTNILLLINAKIYINWTIGRYWNIHDNELLAKNKGTNQKSNINAYIWCIFSQYFCIANTLNVLVELFPTIHSCEKHSKFNNKVIHTTLDV